MSVRILGIIPARGGSKGIRRKNLAPLAGRPLIAWTIDAARRSSSLHRLIISTDDPEISDVARGLGAEVPFLRPAELAQDDTPGVAPVLHAVRWLAAHERYEPDYVMVLQPTSPLRQSADIDGAAGMAEETGCDAVVSVREAAGHPFWTKRITPAGTLTEFMPRSEGYLRRQDLPAAYELNGAVYLIRTSRLLADESLSPPDTRAYVMPAERSIDIDSAWELYLTDLILRDRGHDRD